MTTWYMIDARTDTIFNAVESSEPVTVLYDKLRRGLEPGIDLRLELNPPREMVEHYRYWNERETEYWSEL